MVTSRRPNGTMLAALMILIPAAAVAQTSATSFEELRLLVKAGQAVIVTDSNGHRISGRIGRVSASSLELSGREARTFDEAGIREIRARDSLANGAIAGTAVGIGAGVAIVAALCSDGPGCGPATKVMLGAAGIGAAAGIALDAALGHEVLYRSRLRGRSLTMAPIASRDQRGILLSVRF